MTNEQPTNTNVNADNLKAFIQRIERLNEELKAVQTDIKEVYEEAKSSGYATKPLKQVIKLREVLNDTKKTNEFKEEQYWVEVYKTALNIEEV